MSLYHVELEKRALKDQLFWAKNSPVTFRIMLDIIDELKIHPRTGTGNPKTLRSDRTKWSREISKKDRIIYKIHGNIVTVEVLSARGHYDDH